MKLNILFKSLVLSLSVITVMFKAQVAAEFNNWTARYSPGDYTQSTTAGTWTVTRGSIYPAGSSSIPLNGYVELATQTSTEAAGTLVTPSIPKGGAKSITILAAVRPANISYTEITKILIEKSINNGTWTAISTYDVVTPKTLTVETFTIPVTDYSDNLRFRISRTSGKTIFLDRVVVNPSFVLSSNTASVCPNTP